LSGRNVAAGLNSVTGPEQPVETERLARLVLSGHGVAGVALHTCSIQTPLLLIKFRRSAGSPVTTAVCMILPLWPMLTDAPRMPAENSRTIEWMLRGGGKSVALRRGILFVGVVMRLAPLALILLCFYGYLSSTGQTLPASRPGNINGNLPDGGPGNPQVATVRPELARPSLETNHKQLLSDLQTLITESQALQHELQSTPVGTVSAQSLKRSQRIEGLSKRIRKALKLN